jgi:cytoskeleton protein RodZ
VSEQQAQIPSAAAGEPGPGAALLAERRRQNLSLGDVSRQLKLSVRQVEALERDDFAGFQSAVFVHGFMRNYAKLLGLDPQPLIEAADRIMKPAAPVAREEAPRAAEPVARARKPLWPVAAIVAVLVVGIFFVVGRGKEATSPAVEAEKQAAVAPEPERAAPEPAQEKPAAAQPAAKDEPKREAEETDKPKVAEKPTVAEKPKAAEPPVAAAAPALSIAEAQAATAESGELLVVRMIFEQESWVEIKDRNGNTVFGQLNPAGSRRIARGEPPLTVVIGNAAGVRLFQGAKNVEVDLGPHTRVDVARLTLE